MSKKLSLFLLLISVGLLTALAAGPVFGAGGPPDDQKLKDWHARSLGLFEMEGVFWTDADEQRRIILVGVRNDGMGESAKRRAEKLGIDPASVETVVAEPIHQLTGHDLRSPFRTIQGGTQIQFVSGNFLYSCTLGFNAVRGGVEGFVTNSHCTDKQGGVEDTKHYQSAYPGDFVSTETADPKYLKSTCPRNVRGKVCRYSDSSFSALTDPADGALGTIARPNGVNNRSLDIDTQNPSFTITGEASGNATYGDEMNKVGRTTGWSQGSVTNTCVHTGVQGSKIVQLCQDFVSADVAGGDSGSPVFMINQDGTVTLYGILWGGGTNTFVYSPMANIQMNTTELGALTTYGTPPVDNTAPALGSAEVNATSLVLAYDEALDIASVPAPGDFTIGTDGAAQSVAGVGVNGTAVTLTLSPGVAVGKAITVSYTPGTYPIQDMAENDAVNLGNQEVTNNTPPPPTTISGTVVTESDGTPIPDATVVVEGTVLSATTASDGTYTIVDVPVGTYDVSASADGFVSESKIGVSATGDTTTTEVNFALAESTATTYHVAAMVLDIDKKGPWYNLTATMTMSPIQEGVTVTGTISRSGRTFNYSQTTDAAGLVQFKLKTKLVGETYTAEVTGADDGAGSSFDGSTGCPSLSITIADGATNICGP